jgi:hypothetical protein
MRDNPHNWIFAPSKLPPALSGRTDVDLPFLRRLAEEVLKGDAELWVELEGAGEVDLKAVCSDAQGRFADIVVSENSDDGKEWYECYDIVSVNDDGSAREARATDVSEARRVVLAMKNGGKRAGGDTVLSGEEGSGA